MSVSTTIPGQGFVGAVAVNYELAVVQNRINVSNFGGRHTAAGSSELLGYGRVLPVCAPLNETQILEATDHQRRLKFSFLDNEGRIEVLGEVM